MSPRVKQISHFRTYWFPPEGSGAGRADTPPREKTTSECFNSLHHKFTQVLHWFLLICPGSNTASKESRSLTVVDPLPPSPLLLTPPSLPCRLSESPTTEKLSSFKNQLNTSDPAIPLQKSGLMAVLARKALVCVPTSAGCVESGA